MWYMIEGFNGYEINKNGQVRSMKMMNADPGHLLKLNKYGRYALTNNKNQRVTRTPEQLLDIVFNSGIPLKPRPDNSVYLGSRNKRFYFDKGIKNQKGEVQNIQMDYSSLIIKD